ncbi:helix-turn-helix transcriptional regulator [Oenococcus sicerae]|uniref:helix-turn-helix transcriptional regulator n=1 Tax=Oenococcus sicerae TaxID=2203724 RepID=UPI0010B83727|nr:hypothetical protein OAL24_01394 [Oenococcus sicerae]
MCKNKLDLLEQASAVDIFKYNQRQLKNISATDRFYNRGLMIKASQMVKSDQYSLIKYRVGYMLIVPFSPTEGLILLPKLDLIENTSDGFSNIDFINHSVSLAKLAYFLYQGEEAPDRDITIIQMADSGKLIEQVKSIDDMIAFHIYTVKMIEAITKLDEAKFQESLTDMRGCNIFGDSLTQQGIIRGQKDILIDLISKLSDSVGKYGLPIKKIIGIQMNSIQKIENQSNILNFDAWLAEIPWIYFREFKAYRKSLFTDKAERIKAYLTNHVRENIRLHDIAAELGLAEQTLNAIFKKKFDMTIKQYTIQLKIESAKQVLTSTNLKIKDISEYLSFADESYFILTFNRQCGTTPSKYRAQHIEKVLQ